MQRQCLRPFIAACALARGIDPGLVQLGAGPDHVLAVARIAAVHGQMIVGSQRVGHNHDAHTLVDEIAHELDPAVTRDIVG